MFSREISRFKSDKKYDYEYLFFPFLNKGVMMYDNY